MWIRADARRYWWCAVSDESELWRHNFKQLLFFIEVAKDNFQAAPRSKGVAERSMKEGLREGVFHHLLQERERRAIYSADLREIVDPALEAAVIFLGGPFSTPKLLAEQLEVIAAQCRSAIGAIDAMQDEEEVEQVVEEFETRYLATLATTLSAHHTLANKLANRKEADGEHFDVGEYSFAREPGPGRVHVADLDKAMDSGVSTFSATRGFVSYERFPPIQIMTYGQWFAYIHAIWDEWYRPRLAAAHSRRLDEELLKNDIKSGFMGDLNKIRNDVIHNKSRVKESARNTILSWATEDGLVGMTTERMMGLRTMFPRDDLLAKPTRNNPPKTQNLPWTADTELISSVKQRLTDLGLTKRQQKEVGDEMLRLWLGANTVGK